MTVLPFHGAKNVKGFTGMFRSIQKAKRVMTIIHARDGCILKKRFIGIKGFFPVSR
jgi:hypothetical protein